MSTSARDLLRRVRNRGTWEDVGEVGQNLMAELLECETSPLGQAEYADIHSKKLKVRVEVKTRDSSHVLGIRVSQLETYQAWNSLPAGIHDTLYALISYNSKESKPRKKGEKEPPRKSLLFQARGWSGRQRLVLEHLTMSYLVDIEVIEAMRVHCPTVTGAFSGAARIDDPALKLPRDFLYEHLCRMNFTDMSRKLCLNPSNYVRERIVVETAVPVGSQYHQVKLDLALLVRRSTYRRISPVILRRALALV